MRNNSRVWNTPKLKALVREKLIAGMLGSTLLVPERSKIRSKEI